MIEGQPLIDFGWIAGHLGSIAERIVQHLQLTIIPLVVGIVLSLILAIWAVRQPRAYGPVTAITGRPASRKAASAATTPIGIAPSVVSVSSMSVRTPRTPARRRGSQRDHGVTEGGITSG